MPKIHHSSGQPLDNPFWHALAGAHGRLAECADATCWYPSTVAPFIAVPSATPVPRLDEAARRGLRFPVYFGGVIPESLPTGWHFSLRSSMLQMMPVNADIPDIDASDIRELGNADRPRMLELTRVAFPDFFRERTAELGLYLGVFVGERLAAMAGERLAVEGWQEISGVCTHPDFAGRGYARRLTNALRQRHRARGVASFLHVSESNAAARRLYESMGFVARTRLPLNKVEPIGEVS